MCETIRKDDSTAIIYQLGDLIDRGPYFKEVFDVIDEFDVKTIIGNHEMNFLMEIDGFKKCRSEARQETHGMFNRLNSNDRERILNIMRRSKIYVMNLEILGYINIFSHSPIRGFERMGNMHSNTLNGWACSSRNEPYDHKHKFKHNDIYAFHGHQHWNYVDIHDQINEDIEIDDNLISCNLDGGCVYGKELVGLNVANATPIIIKAKKQYFKPEKRNKD